MIKKKPVLSQTHQKIHIEAGKNDQKIDLGKGQLIDAPSKVTAKTYTKMFENGEQSGKEQLIVSSDNGVNSKIVEGKNGDHLDNEDFKEARVDLISKGETPTSDTHLHPNEIDVNGHLIKVGAASPSDEDKLPENNIGNTKPCVLLGYKDASIPNPNQIGGTSSLKPQRAIGFYDTNGPIGSPQGYSFSSFVNLINKIFNENGNQ